MEFRSYKLTLEWHFQQQIETSNLQGYAMTYFDTVMIGNHCRFLQFHAILTAFL